jgi:SAM-dependent methyltransferase
MCDVYHHIDDRPAYFAKVRDQLKSGGRLVIVDFRKDAADDAPGPPPAMRIAAKDLIAELEGAGWKHVRTDAETLPHQYIVELVPAT